MSAKAAVDRREEAISDDYILRKRFKLQYASESLLRTTILAKLNYSTRQNHCCVLPYSRTTLRASKRSLWIERWPPSYIREGMEYSMVTTTAEIKHGMEDDEECFQNSK